MRHHHEHFNGRGYPDGLAGEDIPYLARILSVADAYDAMMSNRVYRNKLGPGQIVEELLRGRGTQFDSKLVDSFVGLIDSFIPPDQIGLKDFFSSIDRPCGIALAASQDTNKRSANGTGEAAQDPFDGEKAFRDRAAPEPPSARFAAGPTAGGQRKAYRPVPSTRSETGQIRKPSLAPAIRTIDQTAPSPNRRREVFQNAFFRPRYQESKR